MTKRITSEDCEGNIEDIEDGRYNTHVVPVSAEDDPGYEEIDYGDCTEFTVPLGRYGSHVVPIGGGGGGGGSACPNGGLTPGTDINGDACLSVNLKPGGAIILDNGQLAIDTSKLKITTTQVYPAGTDTGIVINGPDGEVWNTQYDYNQWLYTDQERQDEEWVKDQERQDEEWTLDQERQDKEWAKDQERQDEELADLRKDRCPKITCIAVRIASAAEEGVDQIAIQYYGTGAPGHDIFTGVQVISDNPPDVNKKWININGVRYEAESVVNLPSGPQWKLEDSYGNLEYLVGTEVTVDNCATYVKTSGDTMTGDLIVNADVHADRVDSTIVDSGENSNLKLQHNGITKVYVGREQVTVTAPLQLNTEGTLSNHAVTKQYIDDNNDTLFQDILELKEEINAIAPSLEYGSWKFGIPANPNRPPSNGTFYLLDGVTYTDEYEKATGIAIHNNEYVAPGDTDPVDNHTWADADVGELIQLFDSADPDFFLGKITAKNVDTIGQCVYLTVDRIQSSGVPNDNADPVTGEFLTRVNIFKEPSGGNASDFVLKSGDKMTGNLTIDRSADGSTNVESRLTITGSKDNSREAAALIKFINNQTTEPGFLSFRSGDGGTWFTFDQDLDLNNHGLHTVKQIRLNPGAYIGSGTNERIKIRDGSGSQAGTEIQRVGDGKRTFAIRGKPASSTTVGDIFHVYGGTNSDGIYYTGLMSEPTNIVTKSYVDDRARIDISSSSSNRVTGDMWYNPNDGVLYLKVS